MRPRNVLIFPAGTEIGLEIYQALKHIKDVVLFGAGQDVSNHARFIYPEYHCIPKVDDPSWLDVFVSLCERLAIDYVFPAHDDAIVALGREAQRIPARILTSPLRTCEITRSKSSTYRLLGTVIRVPRLYESADDVKDFPVLVKPDKGQGSFGVTLASNREQLLSALATVPNPIICEYLPGEEYTVDCFSDRESGVLFAGARIRKRMRNGISVHSETVSLPEALAMARAISGVLDLHGAWFFQVRRAKTGELALLEVAPRIAGSMATHRVQGVNFPLLSILEAERVPLTIRTNAGVVEIDRALQTRYKHSIEFSTLYLDLDDTLLVRGQVNIELIELIFMCINAGKRIVLITRHAGDLAETLAKHRLTGLFDEIVHLRAGERKSDYVSDRNAIYVDDSFSERTDVAVHCGIPTFDCSMIELLIRGRRNP
nr:MAG: carboxylate--amine ligase [Pseudomonadota bacterium]